MASDQEDLDRADLDLEQELLSHQDCSKCGRSLPLTEQHWYRDNRRQNGFKRICKSCFNGQQEALRDRSLEDRIACLDAKMIARLERMVAIEQPGIPHLAKFFETAVRACGGVDGLVQHMMAGMLMSKAGGETRRKYVQMIWEASQKLSEMGLAKVPVDLLSDEDLEAEIQKRLAALRASEGADAEGDEAAEASAESDDELGGEPGEELDDPLLLALREGQEDAA